MRCLEQLPGTEESSIARGIKLTGLTIDESGHKVAVASRNAKVTRDRAGASQTNMNPSEIARLDRQGRKVSVRDPKTLSA